MALIMNEMYQARQRAILRWMMYADYNIVDMQKTLRYICMVVEARREFEGSSTPENKALASCRLSDVRVELFNYLRWHCFPDNIREAAIWLSEHTP